MDDRYIAGFQIEMNQNRGCGRLERRLELLSMSRYYQQEQGRVNSFLPVFEGFERMP
jgi:hypothetical protein